MRPSRYDESGRLRPGSGRRRVARLNPPNPLWGSNGITFGPDGRLYVAQFLAGQISAVDPASGDVEVVVPLDGPVQTPDDLAFGADGSMYIADLTPGRVWRRTPWGEYSLVTDEVTVPNGITCVGDRLFVNEMRTGGRLLELFPDGGRPVVLTDALAWGNAMQLGPDGLLYYPHMVDNQVWRISPDGGPPELVAEEVDDPVAVRFDLGGVLVVLSRGPAGIVTRIDLATGVRTVTTSGLAGLDNAAFDTDNRMFVSSYAAGGITQVHPDGRTRALVPRGFNGPFGVTAGRGGTVYAADHWRLASPSGHDGEQEDGANTLGLLHFARGITADGALLHITTGLGEVRSWEPDAGTCRVRVRGLDDPTGIAVAPDGGLVVAETGAGRVLRIDAADTVTVLADQLEHPVDIAFDTEGRCHVSDDRRGAVLRLEEDGTVTTVADGLGAPQGLVAVGDELFTVETAHRRLTSVSLTTGAVGTEARDLPVGLPPGTTRTEPDPVPGVPHRPRPFAGLALAPDGSLLLSANGEGTVLRLAPRHEAD
ncbi:hypothetical protein GCM10018793_33020 [Streptomyces sulfonofaciens]|uniref:Gluconolaconase n=1 Tax=Streptomyces sulfonofaciens TaxID=68272 RepID=A0A919L0L4_9ACTN|nr:hypothetical protein [Streptomyces sulfonofaciens]GHH79647.1 hypothetical protein GCM10018793_33020 [Streptomyces sulfonofaciens]